MKILFTKPDALGDQFIAAGPLQALLQHRPGLQIVWHVQTGREVIAPLVGAEVFVPQWESHRATEEAARLAGFGAPLVLLPYPLAPHEAWTPDLRRRLRWWHEFLRATHWDAVAEGLVNRNWVGDFTVCIAPATERLGFTANPMRQPLNNEALSLAGAPGPEFTQELEPSFEKPEARQMLDLLALLEPRLASVAKVPVWRPAGPLPAPRVSGHVLIAPGVGGDPRRAWGLARFRQVADMLCRQGQTVCWIEGPGDAQHLAGLPESPDQTRLRFGPAELPELAATLQSARLLLCHDTAYAHLAAGLGVPTVAIYGAGQRQRFHPLADNIKVVQGDILCSGCQWHCLFDRLACVTDIPAAAVQQAIAGQLAGNGSPQRVALPLPPAGNQAGLVARLQAEILQLNADRFARLQIIQSLLAPETVAHPLPPRFSVIIPMGRPERAVATLNSLANQQPAPANWEIVLVGCAAESVAGQYPQLPMVPVVLARDELPPRTRCLGVECATGAWYLFVDDDVELAPDFLQRSRALLETRAGGTPVGAVGPQLPGKSRRFFGRVTDYSNFWAQQEACAEDRDWLYSAALLVRAEAYHRSGGFNAALPNGEDVDLTRRIKAAGYRLCYEPGLIVRHDHRRDTLTSMWRYFWRNGNAARHFFTAHGGVCCFSLRTALVKTWRDWRMNRAFRHRHGERLGGMTPWVVLNYLIVELSLEYHYQEHLWRSGEYARLPARSPADRTAVLAFQARARGQNLRALAHYALAMLQDLANPVRR
jgi:ADP-heptose:LPS heptosyltransferase/glycosyltransferase involved in cell wall biosynthesis